MTPSSSEEATTATFDRIEVGPSRRVRHPRLRRRVVRGLLTFVGTAVVLLAGSIATCTGYRPPAAQPALVTAPVVVVAPPDRHLPYAYVDRFDTVTDAGRPARVVRPRGAEGTIPGVVLVAGGAETARDELAAEAEALARGGLAVLTYDRRSASRWPSGRDDESETDDALAAIAAVGRLPGVDPDRVGLLGFGEGGRVVLSAAQRSARVAFVVLVSPSVASPLQVAAWRADRAVTGSPRWFRAAVAAAVVVGRPVLGRSKAAVTPALGRMPQPAYAVWGAADETVPVAAAVEAFRSAASAGDPVEVVGGAGHRVPLAAGWAERVSDWVRRGYPADPTIRGVEPETSAGLPTLPTPGPLGDFRLPLVLAGIAAVAAALAPLRRRPSRDRAPR